VSKEEKELAYKQKGISIWFTGLSGSGKSTLAKLLEKKLFEMGHQTVLFRWRQYSIAFESGFRFFLGRSF
jgi:adenylylsulfate kinase-like enzyme